MNKDPIIRFISKQKAVVSKFLLSAGEFVTERWSNLVTKAKTEIHWYSRWGAWTQAPFLALCIWFACELPSPTIAVSFAALAAVVMTVRLEYHPTMIEKIGWILIVFVLIGVDSFSIKEERVRNEETQKNLRLEERAGRFLAVKQAQASMEANNAAFRDLVERSEGIQRAEGTNLLQLTGGGGFAYLDLTGMITPAFLIESKYPLHGVRATIRDLLAEERLIREIPIREHRPPVLQEIMAAQIEVPLGEMAPYHGQPLYPIPSLLQSREERDLEVLFMAFNGYWSEHICLRRATNNVPGGMVLAGSLVVRRGEKILMRHVDANYPKDQSCK